MELCVTVERLDQIAAGQHLDLAGVREPFEREKIRRGLQRACWKRPISDEQIDSTVSAVEMAIIDRLDNEIDSRTLGEMVMERLSELDQVAFVRFASVYREFTDITALKQEVDTLVSNQTGKSHSISQLSLIPDEKLESIANKHQRNRK